MSIVVNSLYLTYLLHNVPTNNEKVKKNILKISRIGEWE